MSSPPNAVASPTTKDPETRPLRRGDLVRVSVVGALKSKRLNERERALGRVIVVNDDGRFDVEWILEGGRIVVDREDLLWTSAEAEGMTNASATRKRRKPSEYQTETEMRDKAKRIRKQEAKKGSSSSSSKSQKTKAPPAKKKPKKNARKPAAAATATTKDVPSTPPPKSNGGKPYLGSKKKLLPETKGTTTAAAKKRKTAKAAAVPPPPPPPTGALDMYEKHRRELERCLKRLEQKIDVFQHFSAAAAANDDEHDDTTTCAVADRTAAPPPRNWQEIRQRMASGRYVLDRQLQERDDAKALFAGYQRKNNGDCIVLACPVGVHWELFRADVFAMLDAALKAQDEEEGGSGGGEEDDDDDADDGQRGTLSYSARKIRETLQQTFEKTSLRQAKEMAFADDRRKYGEAVQQGVNAEAAMQSWRKDPYPERKYERLSADAVCAGLPSVDEKIANFERRTNLPDSFIGLSYRYDDTHQSETWMQSVVDETGASGKQTASNARQAALALSADEGVRKAQVNATMQSLLIAVQDKVMTDSKVLQEPELESANWVSDEKESSQPEIVEQPVWGIDCYTRKNIMLCLEVEFHTETVLTFIEKWLLPAINACPEPFAHKISNAARLLEGISFEEEENEEQTRWSQTVLGTALEERIRASGPSWLRGAANRLRRAVECLGMDFFRVHPKGHGSVVLCKSLPPNTLVTYYRGELYPSWRWGEKMDAIEITQKRTNLKPALPDFYNMVLERPQSDPRGYGLLFVDASRKAGHGSSLSHSCAPTCEVRVAARGGDLCLAMTTLRELEMGEELTFDYNAVTESLNEYRSAVCLCGYGKCRGSFLHFATADCYQQVLNRNSPVAARFANLVKCSMKQVMSPDDEKVLRNHGFNTAAFGAISVIRRELGSGVEKSTLADSIDVVPIWLRTYVADVLRYIEYERRALPIALICDHIATSKESEQTHDDVSTTKEPKREPSFLYFSRTQSSLLSEKLSEQGFPDSLKGLQRKHAMQKVASSYWASLGEREKLAWKEQSERNYEKRVKAWRSQGTKPTIAKKKPDIEEILESSKISFQDADAEGVAAMEQRIQQLTQSLSRVGRVLDRHRESCFEKENRDEFTSIDESVQAPLRFLSETEVVDWLWKNEDGLVYSLISSIRRSTCARLELVSRLSEVREQFLAVLDQHQEGQGVGAQLESKAELMKVRSVILDELEEMAKEFRKQRSEASAKGAESQQTSAVPSDNEEEYDCAGPTAVSSTICLTVNSDLVTTLNDAHGNEAARINDIPSNHQWMDTYGERCALQAAADVVLLYAHTSTFFLLQPYRTLQSTPIEVYARELGNDVPKSVMRDQDYGQRAVANKTERCAPDDIIANVSVEYQGDFVLSQLLQWYNAGIGQQPGLPDLLGCTLLPRIPDCWSSELFQRVKTKSDRKTVYETKVRRRLVEWLQDPFQRGCGWPRDIRKAFAGNDMDSILRDSTNLFVPFGSPIIDFLVTGDESNITNILRVLDRDNKIKKSEASDGLLCSVDKGRPAQAVSTWVQCENPKCGKWRKIPWFVDADALPDKFFCKDNKWNESANSCDHPEDDWDAADALVGADGKVEGTPVKKTDNESLDVTKEESFTLGARFDVKRSDLEKYTVAAVQKVDFSGVCKRIFFHFLRSSSDRDEWVPLGSDRIAPLHSKVSKIESKKDRHQQQNKRKPKQTGTEATLDPSDLSCFVAGARFDVLRNAKERYFPAIVVKVVESPGAATRILFHFMRTSSDNDEWVEFGSTRICRYKTKVPERMEKRKETQIKNATSTEKRLSVLANSISKTVLSCDHFDPEDESSPPISSTNPPPQDAGTTALSSSLEVDDHVCKSTFVGETFQPSHHAPSEAPKARSLENEKSLEASFNEGGNFGDNSAAAFQPESANHQSQMKQESKDSMGRVDVSRQVSLEMPNGQYVGLPGEGCDTRVQPAHQPSQSNDLDHLRAGYSQPNGEFATSGYQAPSSYSFFTSNDTAHRHFYQQPDRSTFAQPTYMKHPMTGVAVSSHVPYEHPHSTQSINVVERVFPSNNVASYQTSLSHQLQGQGPSREPFRLQSGHLQHHWQHDQVPSDGRFQYNGVPLRHSHHQEQQLLQQQLLNSQQQHRYQQQYQRRDQYRQQQSQQQLMNNARGPLPTVGVRTPSHALPAQSSQHRQISTVQAQQASPLDILAAVSDMQFQLDT